MGKRAIFVATLQEVAFPGLEEFGVDTAPARAWLARHATSSVTMSASSFPERTTSILGASR